ncbi:hypothetical protein ALI144C_09660 [Actinosynnema sp. ALI-1.44]|uniref:hypothetical protein n=1 Tax=Actinosynnema sp. ALI-1.44 TaxID=1933779 RepID=UPI00097C24C8|nr:hypothetical protein [Actinosynnema sp. ALI-1.44]ONI86914.1 hypothetical protein ALI144C_09660 [Actinosynnema sp. ALI-1.44]
MTVFARAISVLTALFLLLGGLLVAPASADDTLRVSASVTSAGPFVAGNREDIPIRFSVTNTGTEARRLWGAARSVEGSPFDIRYGTWGDMERPGPGAVVAPGETKTLDLVGYTTSWAGQPRVTIGVMTSPQHWELAAATEFTFPLVPGDVTDRIAGVVFTDANENRVLDPGEELPGISLKVEKDYKPYRESVSGPDGRFSFTDVPVGFYDLNYGKAPAGLLLPYNSRLRLDGTGTAAELKVRARRPMSESLKASVALDRGSYGAGDSARLLVTLTNTGRYPLTEIKAGCDRYGAAQHLVTTPPAWGELAYGGPGAAIKPGQTRVFRVSGTVPQRGDDYGIVSVACDFVDDEAYLDGAAQAPMVYAKVRSTKTGDTSGEIFHDKDGDYTVDEGEAVTNTKVGLRDVVTGRMAAFATSGPNGKLDFTKVPVGRYQAQVFGPWTRIDDYYVDVWPNQGSMPLGALRVVPRQG